MDLKRWSALYLFFPELQAAAHAAPFEIAGTAAAEVLQLAAAVGADVRFLEHKGNWEFTNNPHPYHRHN